MVALKRNGNGFEIVAHRRHNARLVRLDQV